MLGYVHLLHMTANLLLLLMDPISLQPSRHVLALLKHA
jgi:hypothetical protein